MSNLHFTTLVRKVAKEVKRAGYLLNPDTNKQIEGILKVYESFLLNADPFDVMCYLRNRTIYKNRLKQLKQARSKKVLDK